MAELTLKERLRTAAITAETTKRSTIVTALAAPLKRWTEPTTPVDHFLIVPTVLRVAARSFWDEMAHGQFGLAGSIVFLRGASPFEATAPSVAWSRERHSLGRSR